ncbi:MAG: hypothetical protein WC521_07140 [Bdellovibrionales bacterium]
MDIFYKNIACFCFLALVGCAGSAPVNLQEGIDRVPVEASKSRITVYRTDAMYAFAASANVDINGARVASLGRGEAFTGNFRPGSTILSTDVWGAPGHFSITFNALPGASYLFEISPNNNNDAMTVSLFGPVGYLIGASVKENSGPFQITPKDQIKTKSGGKGK